MDKADVFAKVKDQLAKLFNLEPDAISLDKNLADDLELDSLDMVDFVIALNDEEGLLTEKIEPVLFRNAKTVQDVVDTILPYFSAE